MAKYLDIEKFIEAIRVRPPLWNKLDPMHRNAELTSGLWNAVLEEMGGGMTVVELKQKWHNLRDCFRREERTTREGRKKRRWVHYSQMLFLLTAYGNSTEKSGPVNNSNRFRVQRLPIKIETPDDTLELDLNNADSDYCEFIENENFSDEITIEEDDTQERMRFEEDGLSNKSYHNDSNEKTTNPLTEETDEQGKPCRIKIESDEANKTGESSRQSELILDNDDYHFAMSIIPQMRQVPLQRKLRMRIRISEIIAQEAGYDETSS